MSFEQAPRWKVRLEWVNYLYHALGSFGQWEKCRKLQNISWRVWYWAALCSVTWGPLIRLTTLKWKYIFIYYIKKQYQYNMSKKPANKILNFVFKIQRTQSLTALSNCLCTCRIINFCIPSLLTAVGLCHPLHQHAATYKKWFVLWNAIKGLACETTDT